MGKSYNYIFKNLVNLLENFAAWLAPAQAQKTSLITFSKLLAQKVLLNWILDRSNKNNLLEKNTDKHCRYLPLSFFPKKHKNKNLVQSEKSYNFSE